MRGMRTHRRGEGKRGRGVSSSCREDQCHKGHSWQSPYLVYARSSSDSEGSFPYRWKKNKEKYEAMGQVAKKHASPVAEDQMSRKYTMTIDLGQLQISSCASSF